MGEHAPRRVYDLPEDSLLSWEQGVRPEGAFLEFGHSLRHTAFDQVEPFYWGLVEKARRDHVDWTLLPSIGFREDVNVDYVDEFVRTTSVFDGLNYARRDDENAIHRFYKDGTSAIKELLAFPFTDARSAQQLQEGIMEVNANDGLAAQELQLRWGTLLYVLDNADRRPGGKDFLQLERDVYTALEDVLCRFPRVESKLWSDARHILESAFYKDSPLYDYRELLAGQSFSIRADAVNGRFEIERYNGDVGGDAIHNRFSVSAMLRSSYPRQKAFTLIRDVARLAASTRLLGEYVHKYGFTPVVFGDRFSVRNLIHPGFHLMDRPVVPNDVVLSPDEKMLLVTGPTEAGKTTVVRSIGNAMLTAYAFGFVTGDEPIIPPCSGMVSSFVHTDDFEHGMSTFRSEVNALNRLYKHMRPDTFFAGDETLRTSEPEVGPVLLPRIIEGFLERGVRGAIATHFHSAVRDMRGTRGIATRHIDDHCFFRLADGVSPGGYALNSAVRAGLHPDLLGDARNATAEKPIAPSVRLATKERELPKYARRPVSLDHAISRHRPLATLAEVEVHRDTAGVQFEEEREDEDDVAYDDVPF